MNRWRRGRSQLDDDLLSAYVDGELTEAERVAVQDRLAGSPEWRSQLDEIQAARVALRDLESRDAPAGFWDQLLVDGPREPGALDRPIDLGRRRAVSRWVYGAAAVAAAFALAVAVVPRNHEVRPDVATLTNAHAVRASVGGDPIAALAGAAVPVSSRR